MLCRFPPPPHPNTHHHSSLPCAPYPIDAALHQPLPLFICLESTFLCKSRSQKHHTLCSVPHSCCSACRAGAGADLVASLPLSAGARSSTLWIARPEEVSRTSSDAPSAASTCAQLMMVMAVPFWAPGMMIYEVTFEGSQPWFEMKLCVCPACCCHLWPDAGVPACLTLVAQGGQLEHHCSAPGMVPVLPSLYSGCAAGQQQREYTDECAHNTADSKGLTAPAWAVSAAYPSIVLLLNNTSKA
jgi:hypothetical protein